MILDPPEAPVAEETSEEVVEAPRSRAQPKESPRREPAPPSAPPPAEPEEPPRRRPWPWIAGGVVLALVLVFYLSHRNSKPAGAAGAAGSAGSDTEAGGKGGPGGKGGDRPVPVLAATATAKDVPVYLDGLGTVAPLTTVTVKSRVDGQLLRIHFTEGAKVRAGQLLAELDPRPFRVQLMQAEGQKAKDEAVLRNAQADLQRYQVLYAQDSVPKQQLDTQAATVAQSQATLQSDQAQIESARLNLTYARVTAPAAGRVGLRQVDVGNIVHANDANGIVVITQLQPIDVVFTLPADQIPQVLPQVHAGKTLAVDAYDRDLRRKLASGTLLAVDNQIDATTGTVRLKAVFPNDDEALFPAQFVNARLLVDVLHGAVTVPAAAIQRSPQSTFVYVIKADQSVESRNVGVGLTEGDSAVIQQGLAAGERVVIDGVDKLRPGMKVDVSAPGGKGAHAAGGRGGQDAQAADRGSEGKRKARP